ncbi:DUF3311 domain-containing protein [Crateriforma conspicua]|uniref:DUF3311 domain-containing protein n=1 Tax=Crateriforma conspicua TaxID=2527996 RepID=A0A5C5YBK2_9PLAN|nr:DUF3311 domain-containing protein [Crateriforma conspicua]QDV61388.1 hypothetical protein Mal65_05110 [Crateriforma conspicua]TWT72359.1 hypothetical protein Pan14r_46790 [Crateriforma conspicua]
MADSSPQPSGPDSSGTTSKGPWIITALVVLLLIIHQDNWFWDDDTLVFGFMPIGLLYHACISIAASATWFLTTKIAWPLDDAAELTGKADQDGGTH